MPEPEPDPSHSRAGARSGAEPEPLPEPDAASVPRLRTSAPSSSPHAAKATIDSEASTANGTLRARRTHGCLPRLTAAAKPRVRCGVSCRSCRTGTLALDGRRLRRSPRSLAALAFLPGRALRRRPHRRRRAAVPADGDQPRRGPRPRHRRRARRRPLARLPRRRPAPPDRSRRRRAARSARTIPGCRRCSPSRSAWPVGPGPRSPWRSSTAPWPRCSCGRPCAASACRHGVAAPDRARPHDRPADRRLRRPGLPRAAGRAVRRRHRRPRPAPAATAARPSPASSPWPSAAAWLSVKYVPVAGVAAALALWTRVPRRGPPGRVGVAVGAAGVLGVLYAVAHVRWYGGLTPYASGDFFADNGGQLSVMGDRPNRLGPHAAASPACSSTATSGSPRGSRCGSPSCPASARWSSAARRAGSCSPPRSPPAGRWRRGSPSRCTAGGSPAATSLHALPCAVLAIAWWLDRARRRADRGLGGRRRRRRVDACGWPPTPASAT